MMGQMKIRFDFSLEKNKLSKENWVIHNYNNCFTNTNCFYGPEHLSLKVPNIEFDFDVTVDSVQW